MKPLSQSVVLLLIFSATLHAEEIHGKVVSITDGDTITVLDSTNTQFKIRLEGIDAPKKKQAFGIKSKVALGEKIGEKNVVVRWSKRDRYQRILGDVFFNDRHINLEMVQEGMAWHCKQFSKAKPLSDAEDVARTARMGLTTISLGPSSLVQESQKKDQGVSGIGQPPLWDPAHRFFEIIVLILIL